MLPTSPPLISIAVAVGRVSALSAETRGLIGSFLRESVKENTAAAYERDWKSWCSFLREELRSADGLLTGFVEEDKTPIVALFLRSRHEAGMRGRGALNGLHGLAYRHRCS